MKTASYGRILFGASAVLFGIIALMWHDAETWQYVSRIWKLPFGTSIGEFLMAAQIAGGIALLLPRTARAASLVLGVIYALFALTNVPGMIAHPRVYGEYGSFFEQFSLLCGAVAVYASTETRAARSQLARFARLGLGLCAISFALTQIFYLSDTAKGVPTWIPPSQMFWADLTTIAFGLAAIAMLINRRARLAIRLMTLMVALFGVLVWVPLLVAHPQAHFPWSEFALTMLIAGASWSVADSLS